MAVAVPDFPVMTSFTGPMMLPFGSSTFALASLSLASGEASHFETYALTRAITSGGVPAGANTPCHEPTS